MSGWKGVSWRRGERTKARLARVKAQGKKRGRPPGLKDKKKRKRRTVVVQCYKGAA